MSNQRPEVNLRLTDAILNDDTVRLNEVVSADGRLKGSSLNIFLNRRLRLTPKVDGIDFEVTVNASNLSIVNNIDARLLEHVCYAFTHFVAHVLGNLRRSVTKDSDLSLIIADRVEISAYA